jgi:hypothetical protein
MLQRWLEVVTCTGEFWVRPGPSVVKKLQRIAMEEGVLHH